MKQQQQNHKSQYYFKSPQLDNNKYGQNNKQQSLYYSKTIFDVISMPEKKNSHNQVNQNSKLKSSDSKDTTPISEIIGRTSWINPQTPRKQNYVNLSYQKIKSLNASSSINVISGYDRVEEDKNYNKKSFDNQSYDSKLRLSYIINLNQSDSFQNSRRSTIRSNTEHNTDFINDNSIENNKVSQYQVTYDNNMIKYDESLKKQQKQQEQYLLQLQLSPIQKRIKNLGLSQIQSPKQEQYSQNEYIFNNKSNQNSTKNKVEESASQIKDQKLKKEELKKKVKLSTEHAFHLTSGTARLKNKRQMFSPCQSARHECKVQFENKYLIKTTFIQPNDNNKEIQMVPVSLIQNRREKLLAQLESLQIKKAQITEQQKVQQINNEDEIIEKKIMLIQKKESQQNKPQNPSNNNGKNVFSIKINDQVTNIEQQDNEDQISEEEEQSDQLSSSFSKRINQLKMIDNYNIMMKGIQNQLNDLDEVIMRDRSQSQNTQLNVSQSSSHITRDKSQTIQSSMQNSYQNSIQNSPHSSKNYQNIHNRTNQSIQNQQTSIHLIQSMQSSRNVYYQTPNSSQKINQSVRLVQSSHQKSRKQEIQDPMCNSNEILNRYTKQKQKSQINENQKIKSQDSVKLFIDIPSSPSNQIEKLFTHDSTKSNTSQHSQFNNKFNFNIPTTFSDAQNDLLNLDKTQSIELQNFLPHKLSYNPSIQSVKNSSLEQNLMKKSSFRFFKQDPQDQINDFSKQKNYFSQNNENNIQFEKQQSKDSNKINSNVSLDQHFEGQDKQQIEGLNIDSSVIVHPNEVHNTENIEKIKSPQHNNSLQINKKHEVDKQSVSALLSSWSEAKKQVLIGEELFYILHLQITYTKGQEKQFFHHIQIRKLIIDNYFLILKYFDIDYLFNDKLYLFYKIKKINYPRIRKLIIDFLKKIKQSKLSIEEYIQKKNEIFMDKPMQRVGSFVFFKAVKHNNIAGVKRAIQQCRYYVFDFDVKGQTCLHKAAKKGYTELLQYFISQGADLNALDIVGRKPLYYAIKSNNYECVKELLTKMANPWSCKNSDYSKMSEQNPKIKDLLKQFRKMHLILLFTPYKCRQNLINETITKDSKS